MDNNGQSKVSLDNLLSKYIAVWIWSILFGALSGVTYSFLGGYYEISNWGPLSLLLVIEVSIGLLASIGAWLYMFQYLVKYIVPRFVHNSWIEQDSQELNTHSVYWIRQVFLLIILALAMRLVMELSMLIFSVLQS